MKFWPFSLFRRIADLERRVALMEVARTRTRPRALAVQPAPVSAAVNAVGVRIDKLTAEERKAVNDLYFGKSLKPQRWHWHKNFQWPAEAMVHVCHLRTSGARKEHLHDDCTDLNGPFEWVTIPLSSMPGLAKDAIDPYGNVKLCLVCGTGKRRHDWHVDGCLRNGWPFTATAHDRRLAKRSGKWSTFRREAVSPVGLERLFERPEYVLEQSVL